MSIFICSKCGCIENTAVSNYWYDKMKKQQALCSECDPKIGKWHGKFPKEKPTEEQRKKIENNPYN